MKKSTYAIIGLLAAYIIGAVLIFGLFTGAVNNELHGSSLW